MVYAFSRTMDKAQRNYSVTDKELLAVVKSVEFFRRYLMGKNFILRTDHEALTFIQTNKNPTGRFLRWGLRLQEFDFTPEFIKGEKNGADGLSRFTTIIARVERVKSITLQENQNKIIAEYHQISGHGSSNTMKFLIRKKYIWPGIFKDIENYVKECAICQRAGNEKINTKNKPIITNKFNDMWECDLMGRIKSKDGTYKFIFFAVNNFSKLIETRVIKTKDMAAVKKCVEDLIIRKHGAPKTILSDNGCEFNNELVSKLAVTHGIEWKFCSPMHHKTVGNVERINRTLWNIIRKLSNFGAQRWEDVVEKATYALNISPTRSTGTAHTY
jgi:hypothetical protein